MAIIPTEPSPGPSPVPDLPPIGEPSPPIKEPEPDYLPDEEPNPNPDENDEPARQTGITRGQEVERPSTGQVPLVPIEKSEIALKSF